MASLSLDFRTFSGDVVASVETHAQCKVDELWARLTAAGEHRIPSLVCGDAVMRPTFSLEAYLPAGAPSGAGRHTVNVIFRTKEWLEEQFPATQGSDHESISTAMRLMRNDMESCRFRADAELSWAPCTGQQLKASGFTLEELRNCQADHCIKAFSLRSCGFTVRDMLAHGYDFCSLKAMEFTFQDFVDSGIEDATELIRAGFTALDFLDNGYSIVQLQRCYSTALFSGKVMQRAGMWPSELRERGYTAASLKTAGFTLAQLKEGGFSLQELKDGGYAAWVLGRAGYTMRQLQEVGFTSEELADAGFVTAAAKGSSRASRTSRTSSPAPSCTPSSSRPSSRGPVGTRSTTFHVAGNLLIASCS